MCTNKMETVVWWAIWPGLFLFFLIGNTIAPYMADDHAMAFVRGASLRMALQEGVKLCQASYAHHCGSIAPFVLFPVAMNYPKAVFNIINSGWTTFLIFMLYRLLETRKRDVLLLGLATSVFLLCIAVPVQVLFWLTGSIVYLWALAWCVLFIFFYSRYNNNTQHANNKLLLFVIPCLGLVIGNSHGSMGGVSFLSTLLFMAYWRCFLKIRIPLWAILGSIASLAGTIAMVVSPGNWNRLDHRPSVEFVKAVYIQAKNLSFYHAFLGSLLIMCIVLMWMYTRNKRDDRFVKMNIFAALGVAGILALLIIPASPRTPIFFPFFAALSLGMALQLLPDHEVIANIKKGFLCVLVLTLGVKYYYMYRDGMAVRAMVRVRESEIRSQIKEGKNPVRVLSMTTWNIYQRYTGYWLPDLDSSPDYWQNEGIAKFYGAPSIVGITDWEYRREHGKTSDVDKVP